MSDNDGWIQFASVLGGGAVGFLSSLFLEPVKRLLFRPDLRVLFPIRKDTDLSDSSTTPYLPFMIEPIDPRAPLITERRIAIRCIVKNDNRFITAESCRVLLTKIETRDSPEHEWKPTEYKESNQVAWSEKTFEFSAVDIFPWTSNAFEPIILIPEDSKVIVQIPNTTHFSFRFLFPSPLLPKGRGWKFSFLITGKNFPPIPFDFTLDCPWKEEEGTWFPLFKVNGCPLELEALITRNLMDPETYAAEQERRKSLIPPKTNIPM